jgi:DNA-binding NarL/FixJ family response regulator
MGVKDAGTEAVAQRIAVFLIAEIRLYREGIAQALASDDRFVVTGSAARHDDGRRAMLALTVRPDVALIDAGGTSGLAGARMLRAALPDVPLVALAIDDRDETVVAWAEAGVSGLVTASTALDGLMATIESVARGGARCSPRATAALLRRVADLASHRRGMERPRGRLTPREREVIALIDRGLSNKQIARALQIELPTVKNHVHAILEKLHVERRGEAAAVARGEELFA